MGRATRSNNWGFPRWGGYGGSLVVADMNQRLCMAYAMNKMAATTVGDMRAGMLAALVWQALAA